jgi:hypothetical protein
MYTERSLQANGFRQGCDPQIALNRKVFPQHPLHFRACASGDADHLVTRSLAGNHLNRRARHGKYLGKELYHRKVGPSFQRRRGKRKLKRIAHRAGDRCSRSPWLHADRKGSPQRVVTNRNQNVITQQFRMNRRVIFPLQKARKSIPLPSQNEQAKGAPACPGVPQGLAFETWDPPG